MRQLRWRSREAVVDHPDRWPILLDGRHACEAFELESWHFKILGVLNFEGTAESKATTDYLVT